MAEGIIIRLTHGQPVGVAAQPYIVDDVVNPLQTSTRGNVYVPYGVLGVPGTIDLPLTSSVAKSMEAGSIYHHMLAGRITVTQVNGEIFGDGVAQVLRLPFLVSPGNTIIDVAWVPVNCRVLSVQAYLEVAAVSVGTYTLAVQHGPDNALVNLLSAATFNLKTLVAQTVTTVGLTATSANKNVAANRRIKFTVASNNGDLVAAGLSFELRYGLR